jgi:hypothetical protein
MVVSSAAEFKAIGGGVLAKLNRQLSEFQSGFTVLDYNLAAATINGQLHGSRQYKAPGGPARRLHSSDEMYARVPTSLSMNCVVKGKDGRNQVNLPLHDLYVAIKHFRICPLLSRIRGQIF